MTIIIFMMNEILRFNEIKVLNRINGVANYE